MGFYRFVDVKKVPKEEKILYFYGCISKDELYKKYPGAWLRIGREENENEEEDAAGAGKH